MDNKGAKLLTGPCIGGPLDGQQIELTGPPSFDAEEPGNPRRYRYLQHRLRGEQSEFSFFTLDTIPVDHALSYLLRGYKSPDTIPQVRLTA